MEFPPPPVRTVATAMLIMGLLVELVGIAFLAADRSTAAAMSVVVTGLLLVMMGVVFLAQSRR